ncbi:pilus assembly protein [Lysobacter sp.]|uniref:pilus assembly protein n=1 Tax=Lysobacter sp. TaxID=72226 RepID=UPI002D39BE7D|nr:PilC/PilY family type IV pilus protein [Lysobacter sp.]HZX76298.1 PilC/PilY family type IV pilus protein [Lysobacter sp.]
MAEQKNNFGVRSMTVRSSKLKKGRAMPRWMAATLAALITAVTGTVTAQVDIAQAPLYVGSRVPGNLALVPSVEYPTIISQANIGPYDVNRKYMGYFDADKCYTYVYDDVETKRHFQPVATTANHQCSNTRWSGNFLNWAATQTIDPFRLALTGGYRVLDEPSKTWLEKARHDRNSLYPNRSITSNISTSTPASWGSLVVRVQGLGNKMYLAANYKSNGDNNDIDRSGAVPYNPDRHSLIVKNNRPVVEDTGDCQTRWGQTTCQNLSTTLLEVSVRVAVCVEGLLEPNCKQYSQGWKPEGLIQEYSDRIRYSIFGYLNDSSITRDGGVLRANQKFVGPETHDPTRGVLANSAREWDPTTGVLYANPDAAAAAATPGGITNSGVINYLNKFGQMTSAEHKSIDPVSELYYTAVRYFKKQGNVTAYSDISSNAYTLADGFPVITDWNDPIQYRCQANVVLGIGDVYTHRDKNLPGNSSTSEEPKVPAEVSADKTVDVVKATKKVAELEGITINTPFTGRNNSAYIAGLAYDSHTRDIRGDVSGKQTIATHWVDVRENQILEPKTANQYWLAAKYGGFRVPEDFDPYARTQPLDPSWWHSNTDYLTSGANGGTTSTVTNYPRADNFYVASEADKMIESLTKAFKQIAAEVSGSSASLAANSTRLESGAMAYQARFYSPSWRGELSAYALDPTTGGFSADPVWNAGDMLGKKAWTERKIYVHNPQAAAGKRYQLATWDALGAAQQSALGEQKVLDYLRGDRTNEGVFRTRQSVLGDIVHSQPVYVGQPDARLYYGAGFDGAADYVKFAEDQAQRLGVVYVGANDGMLHAFNAETGEEVYAFMPAAAINADLKSLTSPDYEHRFFVDGEVTVADVYSKADKEWKTILVGSMGRGGKAVFALDVTDPEAVKFLWEKNATDVAALGNVLGKPIIAQVANGDWQVLIGNGPNSSTGTAQLVMIGVESGTVTTVSTGVSGDNGLSAVDAWDKDRDGFYDTVYGGDLAGNLWRFTGVGKGTAKAEKMFEAVGPDSNVQPITAAPLIMMNTETRDVWVYVGTGRYLGSGDVANKDVQSWYGLMDKGAAITGRTDLVESEILAEVAKGDLLARVTSELKGADLAGKSGWYMDLVSPVNGKEGERMVVPNRFERGMLLGTTRIPDSSDVCSPGGRGFVMAIDPFTGSRPSSSFFDVNGDGKFDDKDMVKVGDKLMPASGIGFGSSPNGPIFVDDDMLVNLDDGSKKKIDTRGTGSKASRISWRELLMD